MDAESILTISAAVVALTQLVKWSGVDDKHGPIAVLVLSALGVVMWGWSNYYELSRSIIWPYFSAFIAVATSAAGVFGFTRASREAVTKTTPPPPGAGSSPTV